MSEQGTTEEGWAEDAQAPPKKKGFPLWLMFCGGGCLLAVLIVVIAGGLLWNQIKGFDDPEVQWPRLEEHIGVDERPDELQLLMGFGLGGFDMYTFNDTRGYAVVFQAFDIGDADEAREQLFDPEFKGGLGGFGARKDASLSQLEVQGRALDVIRYYQFEGEEADTPAGGKMKSGVSATIDLTKQGDPGLLVLTIVRGSGEEPVPDDYIRELLAPFHVGPER